MAPTLIRAKTAGFCMGVDLALQRLEKTVDDTGQTTTICTLGPIIHNPQVLERYKARGVEQVDAPSEIPEHSRAVIRAHGIPKRVHQTLNQRDIDVIDATCPRVKTAQKLIARQSGKGRRMFLFGEREHPEVIGLLSYADDRSVVFETLEELKAMDIPDAPLSFLAAQTTQDREEFERVLAYLKEHVDPDIPVCHTICDATRQRQKEAMRIASEVDVMVVVGGYNSGNTRRLVQVAASQGARCIHVEHAGELKAEDFQDVARVGLTAGASTPKDLIDEVQEHIESIMNQAGSRV